MLTKMLVFLAFLLAEGRMLQKVESQDISSPKQQALDAIQNFSQNIAFSNYASVLANITASLDSIENARNANPKLYTLVASMTEALNSLQSKSGSIAKSLSDAGTSETALGNVAESLNAQVTGELNSMLEQLGRHHKDFDSNVATAIEKIEGFTLANIQSLATSREYLGKAREFSLELNTLEQNLNSSFQNVVTEFDNLARMYPRQTQSTASPTTQSPQGAEAVLVAFRAFAQNSVFTDSDNDFAGISNKLIAAKKEAVSGAVNVLISRVSFMKNLVQTLRQSSGAVLLEISVGRSAEDAVAILSSKMNDLSATLEQFKRKSEIFRKKLRRIIKRGKRSVKRLRNPQYKELKERQIGHLVQAEQLSNAFLNTINGALSESFQNVVTELEELEETETSVEEGGGELVPSEEGPTEPTCGPEDAAPQEAPSVVLSIPASVMEAVNAFTRSVDYSTYRRGLKKLSRRVKAASNAKKTLGVFEMQKRLTSIGTALGDLNHQIKGISDTLTAASSGDSEALGNAVITLNGKVNNELAPKVRMLQRSHADFDELLLGEIERVRESNHQALIVLRTPLNKILRFSRVLNTLDENLKSSLENVMTEFTNLVGSHGGQSWSVAGFCGRVNAKFASGAARLLGKLSNYFHLKSYKWAVDRIVSDNADNAEAVTTANEMKTKISGVLENLTRAADGFQNSLGSEESTKEGVQNFYSLVIGADEMYQELKRLRSTLSEQLPEEKKNSAQSLGWLQHQIHESGMYRTVVCQWKTMVHDFQLADMPLDDCPSWLLSVEGRFN